MPTSMVIVRGAFESTMLLMGWLSASLGVVSSFSCMMTVFLLSIGVRLFLLLGEYIG